MTERLFTAGPNDAGKRIDRVLRKLFPQENLSILYKALRKGDISLNGKKAQLETRIAEGDSLLVRGRLAAPHEKPRLMPGLQESPQLPSQDLSSHILHESQDILILNKPIGITSQGPGGLDDEVKAYLAGRLSESLAFAPGPLHRLDRNTSGVLCFSKSITGAREGCEAFRDRSIKKIYLAILDGAVLLSQQWIDSLARLKNEHRTIRSEDKGQKAVSLVIPLAKVPGHSLCLFSIETGRTHQIRVQASLHGHPLSGDKKYGSRTPWKFYLLHCLALAFPPQLGLPRVVRASLPQESAERLRESFGEEAAGLVDEALARIFQGAY